MQIISKFGFSNWNLDEHKVFWDDNNSKPIHKTVSLKKKLLQWHTLPLDIFYNTHCTSSIKSIKQMYSPSCKIFPYTIISSLSLPHALWIYDRGEPAISYRWTGWVWGIPGWSSRLQEITDHFRGIYRIYHYIRYFETFSCLKLIHEPQQHGLMFGSSYVNRLDMSS